MNCLNCREPMRTVVAGIEFEECPRCDAHFFDRSELSHFLADGGMAFQEIKLRAALEPPSRCRWCETQNAADAERCGACDEVLAVVCPRDGQRMMAAHAEFFDIDVCPTCTAMWLDGDELRRLVENLRAAPKRAAEVALVPMADAHTRPCQVCEVEKPASHVHWYDGLWQCAACRNDEKVQVAERLEALREASRQGWAREEQSSRFVKALKPMMDALTVKVGPWGRHRS